MNSIAFIDIEVSLKTHEILDIGGLKDNGNSFHSNSISDFISFINGTGFICGHNILRHDLIYLRKKIKGPGLAGRENPGRYKSSSVLLFTHFSSLMDGEERKFKVMRSK
jgi:hypothetical protein